MENFSSKNDSFKFHIRRLERDLLAIALASLRV
jgi:hypothetical protein